MSAFTWWEIDPNGIALTVPTLPGVPLYDMRVTLGGSSFVLTFDWSDREQRYYLTVSDVSGNVLVAGLKLISGAGVMQRFVSRAKPQGNFIVADPESLPPTVVDFGQRSFLLFFPKS